MCYIVNTTCEKYTGGESMEVKKNNKLSKWIVSGAGKVLTLVAVVFASTPCYGHLYEPEIPQQLKKKDK